MPFIKEEIKKFSVKYIDRISVHPNNNKKKLASNLFEVNFEVGRLKRFNFFSKFDEFSCNVT